MKPLSTLALVVTLSAMTVSMATAERKLCDPLEPDAPCFLASGGPLWLAFGDDGTDPDGDGVIDHITVAVDSIGNFVRLNPNAKRFIHLAEKTGYMEYCPFPAWEWSPDHPDLDKCIYGTGDSRVSAWVSQLGWCPAKVELEGFGVRPSDGREFAMLGTFQTIKRKGECLIKRFNFTTAEIPD